MQKSVRYNGNEVFYARYGSGDLAFVACHGYGERGNVFQQLNGLADKYTIIALDLPFHGKTEWNELFYTPAGLAQFIQLILKHEKVELYGFMGFSMGGRIATKLMRLDCFSPKVLLLFAPEGVYRDTWHSLFRLPRSLRYSLSNFYLENSSFFSTASKYLVKVRLLTRSAYTFMRLHDVRYLRRKRLVGMWNTYEYFQVDWRDVSLFLEEKNVTCFAYLGEHDITLDPVKQATVLTRLKKTKVHMINHAHFVLNNNRVIDFVNEDLESMS